jgi:hypothetical protein
MPSTTMRRPLPALIFLIALTLLAALVWWRVLSRSHHSATPAQHCSAPPSGALVLPPPSSVTVVVLNSTQRNGLAGAARAALLRAGFRSPDPPRNDLSARSPLTGVAQIRYPTGMLGGAKLLQYYLPGATLTSSTATDGKIVVSLGKAYRSVASAAAVRAAMTRDKVSVGPSPTSSASASASQPASASATC